MPGRAREERSRPVTQMNLATAKSYALYALPHCASSWIFASYAVLYGVYAKYYGLSLVAIAGVILVVRLVDAFTDLVIGAISDSQRRRQSSRMPLMLIGGVLSPIAGYFLLIPIAVDVKGLSAGTAESNISVFYFLVFYSLYFITHSLFQVPHLAWGGEIAGGSREKTEIFGTRVLSQKLGKMLFYAVPLFPVFASDEITPEVLQLSVILAGGILYASLFLMVTTDLEGRESSEYRVPNQELQVETSLTQKFRTLACDLGALFVSMGSNKPMLLLACISAFSGMAIGAWSALAFIYVDAYLQLGDVFAQASLVASAAALAIVIVNIVLVQHFENKWIWIGGKFVHLMMLLVFALLTPDNAAPWQLFILFGVIYAVIASFNTVELSIVSEVIDYGMLKSGENHGAGYFSAFALISKIIGSVAGAVGLGVAGLFGFDPSADVHSADAVFGLRLAFIFIPGVLLTVGLILSVYLPITRRRHGIIRKRLDQRQERLLRAQDQQSIQEETYISTLQDSVDNRP